jgi:hypothetical protein
LVVVGIGSEIRAPQVMVDMAAKAVGIVREFWKLMASNDFLSVGTPGLSPR